MAVTTVGLALLTGGSFLLLACGANITESLIEVTEKAYAITAQLFKFAVNGEPDNDYRYSAV